MTAIQPLADHSVIEAALDERAQAELAALTAEVADDPSRLSRVFPAAARRTGRGPLPGADGVLLEDAVRVSLVQVAARSLDPEALLTELREVYRYGDSDEKRREQSRRRRRVMPCTSTSGGGCGRYLILIIRRC